MTLLNEDSVLVNYLIIDAHAAAGAQIADQIPVQRRGVAPTGLGVGAPERQVGGAGDLLVEQDQPGGPVNPLVGPDPQLSEIPCPLVDRYSLHQIPLLLLGTRL